MADSVKFEQYGLTTLNEEGLGVIEKSINEYELEWNNAVVVEDEDNYKQDIDFSARSCKTSFLPVRGELVDLFGPLISDYNTNRSGWNFDIGFIEAFQLCHYHEGDFYNWHVDSFNYHFIEPEHQHYPNRPCNRKISLTVFLNDPDEYDGGEFDLEIAGPNAEKRFDTMKLSKGGVVIFPSYMWHRVRPVTSGIRKSMVLWIQGPPFK